VHLAEDAHAQRRERGGELAGVVEDLHGRDYQLDKVICQIVGGGIVSDLLMSSDH
jgi:hypothetical protein